MNRKPLTLILLILVFFVSCKPAARKNTIVISGAWALYPLTVKWAEEYKKIHPEIRIDISAGGAGKGMADVLSGLADIGMVSRRIFPVEMEKGAFPLAVAKDAVVAVVSDRNPVLKSILSGGLTRNSGSEIWLTSNYVSWGKVTGTAMDVQLHSYIRSDACGAAETWAEWLGSTQDYLHGIGVYGDPGIAQAVRQDSLGIGFNNIGYAFDYNSKKPIAGLKIVPLDVNEDGIISEEESFYETIDDVVDAISEGRYPSPPARELYFVLKGKPGENLILKDFLKWVLTSGQQYVREAGYVPLSRESIESDLRGIE